MRRNLTLFNKVYSVFFVIIASGCIIFGQNKTKLYVEVIDQNLDAIIGGEISLYNQLGQVIARKPLKEQKVIFDDLAFENIQIEIKSDGFQTFKQNILLKNGDNTFIATLKIIDVKSEVQIKQSELDKRINEGFSLLFTQEEIDALPDNPQDIEEELKRRYGNDLVIRVNGFLGGAIPPKSLIRSIQVSRSGFDAEFHELGVASVNITTKSSIPKYIGSLMLNYGNSIMNARNAFALQKPKTHDYTLLGFLAGPITKTSSFNFIYSKADQSREENIISKTSLTKNDLKITSGTSNNSFTGVANFDIRKNHSIRLQYQNSSIYNQNVGIGGLNLVERGFNIKAVSNEFKFSFDSLFYKKYFNQFRSRLVFNYSEVTPNSDKPGITILDTLNAGGVGLNNISTGKRLELFEMVSTGYGKHFLKFGGEITLENRYRLSKDGLNGNFFFNDVKSFLTSSPFQYVRTDNERSLNFSNKNASIFIQGDFRILPRVQLGLGGRYEIQNNISDKNNFSPRLSVVAVLDKKSKFVLRCGMGRLFQWYETNTIQRILENNGITSKQTIIINPSFPNPYSNGVLAQTLLSSIYKQESNLVNPYQDIIQTALNGKLAGSFKFDTIFSFQNGSHLFRSRDINSPILGIRPNQYFGRIQQIESSGMFRRISLEVGSSGVLFKRVRVSSVYRLSKSVDDISDIFSLPTDSYNLKVDKGPSDNDQRHFFTEKIEFSPFKNINVSQTFTVTSPLPYTITTGLDENKDLVFNDRPAGIARNSEKGAWAKNVNLSIQWKVPFIKKHLSESEKNNIEALPDNLKYHKLNISLNAVNLFNSNNKSGFIGNQSSPFFGKPTRSAAARSIFINLTFIYF